MKSKVAIALMLTAFLTACGKKDVAASEDAGEEDVSAANVSETTQAELNPIQQNIEKEKYDDAVAGMVRAQESIKTEADRWAVRKQLQETHDALLEKAQTDPAAREAYNNLARLLQATR